MPRRAGSKQVWSGDAAHLPSGHEIVALLRQARWIVPRVVIGFRPADRLCQFQSREIDSVNPEDR